MPKSCVILRFCATLAGRGPGRNVFQPSSKTSKTEWGQWKGGWTGSKQRWNSCEAYRRARVEHSRGLAELWTRIDNWEIPGNRIKEEASKIMDEEAQLSKQVEDQAQAKSQELSTRPLPETVPADFSSFCKGVNPQE